MGTQRSCQETTGQDKIVLSSRPGDSSHGLRSWQSDLHVIDCPVEANRQTRASGAYKERQAKLTEKRDKRANPVVQEDG